MSTERPYELRSSDVIFDVWATRPGIQSADREAARADFYVKPRACLRSSDLGKKWGWGIHADEAGRLGVHASALRNISGLHPESLRTAARVKVRAAMRSKR